MVYLAPLKIYLIFNINVSYSSITLVQGPSEHECKLLMVGHLTGKKKDA